MFRSDKGLDGGGGPVVKRFLEEVPAVRHRTESSGPGSFVQGSDDALGESRELYDQREQRRQHFQPDPRRANVAAGLRRRSSGHLRRAGGQRTLESGAVPGLFHNAGGDGRPLGVSMRAVPASGMSSILRITSLRADEVHAPGNDQRRWCTAGGERRRARPAIPAGTSGAAPASGLRAAGEHSGRCGWVMPRR